MKNPELCITAICYAIRYYENSINISSQIVDCMRFFDLLSYLARMVVRVLKISSQTRIVATVNWLRIQAHRAPKVSFVLYLNKSIHFFFVNHTPWLFNLKNVSLELRKRSAFPRRFLHYGPLCSVGFGRHKNPLSFLNNCCSEYCTSIAFDSNERSVSTADALIFGFIINV